MLTFLNFNPESKMSNCSYVAEGQLLKSLNILIL